MRILIAPDKFKGTLSALEAAQAIEMGIRSAIPDACCILAPIADGGDGTIDVITFHNGGTEYSTSVHALDGNIVLARWLELPHREALIESAACVSGGLIEGERTPQYYHSLGLGELILRAIGGGMETIYVALGGTGTHDAGIGMAHAFGYSFYDSYGMKVDTGAGVTISDLLGSIRHVQQPEYNVFNGIPVIALTDVTSTLCGSSGAAFTYAEQKGFSPSEIPILDASTSHFAGICSNNILEVDQYAEGMGAGGGLGFALATFCGAEMRSGIRWVMERIRFNDLLAEADLVISGEGKLDMQTLNGKAVLEVAERASAREIPVVAFAGIIQEKQQLNIKAMRLSDAVEVSPMQKVPASKEEAVQQLQSRVCEYFSDNQLSFHA